jgi:sodium transport system permease protein
MTAILNIWRKELMDTLRDRKALRQSLLIPLIIGIIYAVMNPAFSAILGERSRAPLTIPAQGIENAPQAFIDTLTAFEITLEPFAGDLRAHISTGADSAGLIIPSDFGSSLSNEAAANVTLLTNPVAGGLFGGGFAGGERLDLALSAFNALLSQQRIEARDLPQSILTPITLQNEDLSTPAQRGGIFASFTLPLLVVIVVVQSGLFVAIDVTAGEKERGTLEALLVTPATDVQVMIGKLLAVFTISVVPYVLTMLAFYLASVLLPEDLRAGGVLPFSVIATAILVGIPTALLMSVVQMTLSVRTKTYKDAQSAAAPLSLGALVPAFAAAILPPASPLAYLIPVYGAAGLVGKMTTNGGVLDGAALALCIIGTLAAAGVAFVLAMRLFDRERLLYAA